MPVMKKTGRDVESRIVSQAAHLCRSRKAFPLWKSWWGQVLLSDENPSLNGGTIPSSAQCHPEKKNFSDQQETRRMNLEFTRNRKKMELIKRNNGITRRSSLWWQKKTWEKYPEYYRKYWPPKKWSASNRYIFEPSSNQMSSCKRMSGEKRFSCVSGRAFYRPIQRALKRTGPAGEEDGNWTWKHT